LTVGEAATEGGEPGPVDHRLALVALVEVRNFNKPVEGAADDAFV
jgi:hypothetical protein